MAVLTKVNFTGLAKCLSLLIIFLVIGNVSSLDRTLRNELFQGDKVSDFYLYCTSQSTEPCLLSSPEDFHRLYQVKVSVKILVDFYLDSFRLVVIVILLIVILVLMIHLTVVGHFEWKTLPIIKIYAEKDASREKSMGVHYQQFTWMKYLVLRGVHRIFKNRDIESINWYKYKQQGLNFDHKEVEISRFTFLDKKNLTKHLMEEIEKEATVTESNVHR